MDSLTLSAFVCGLRRALEDVRRARLPRQASGRTGGGIRIRCSRLASRRAAGLRPAAGGSQVYVRVRHARSSGPRGSPGDRQTGASHNRSAYPEIRGGSWNPRRPRAERRRPGRRLFYAIDDVVSYDLLVGCLRPLVFPFLRIGPWHCCICTKRVPYFIWLIK
jgi:hypothetical protein